MQAFKFFLIKHDQYPAHIFFLSSAKNLTVAGYIFREVFIKMMNSIGSIIKPCGFPLSIVE